MREPTAEEGQRLIKRSDFTFINLRLKEANREPERTKSKDDLRNLQELHKDSATFNSCGSLPDAKTENLVTGTGGAGPDDSNASVTKNTSLDQAPHLLSFG